MTAIPSDLRDFVAKQISLGRYENESDLIAAGLHRLAEDDVLLQQMMVEYGDGLLEKLNVGVEQADRGEFVGVDNAFDEIERKLGSESQQG